MLQQQNSPSQLTPSSMRPVPLRCREDLVIEQIYFRGVAHPVIKDPVGLKYYRLQPEQYEILKHLDGQRSLQDLRDVLQVEFPTTHITPSDVQSVITDLHEKGLLHSERMRQGETNLKRDRERRLKDLKQLVLSPMFMRFPGWDPDRLLTRLCPWCGWIFSVQALIFFSLMIALSWLFVAVRFDDIRQRLPEFQQFFGWPNLIFLWLTMALTKVLHEFGHGIACKYFGGECHSMGVVLMVFSPTLYCDVTDSWMMKNKWHRILIGAGGMYVEMILATFAILLWYNIRPGLLQHIALNVFFISTVTTVLFNANPLLRYDGYYMLSDYLEIPNLQSKASQAMSQTFAWWVLGIEQPQDPFMPTSGHGWFILYLVASALYRWFVLFGVTLFLYTVLKPYRLQSLGILAATFSILAVVGSLCGNLFKMLISPRRDPISRFKLVVILLLLVGGTAAFLKIPIPWYEQAACYLEPTDVQHVYALLPGVAEHIAVHPGQEVSQGQLLMQMHSPELFDRADKLRNEIEVQQVELTLHRELQDPEGLHLATQRLQALSEQFADVEKQLSQLRLVAPVAGHVLEPPRVRQPAHDSMQQQLATWSGTPLEQRNLGLSLEPGSHICSIAPVDSYQAVLLIGQADRGDLKLGDRVRLKLESFPQLVLNGTVKSFSRRELEYAPPSLSNKHGGPLTTMTDSQGREVLTDAMYQATVDLDHSTALPISGIRGNVRFMVAERSLATWLWRSFRTLFHFRL